MVIASDTLTTLLPVLVGVVFFGYVSWRLRSAQRSNPMLDKLEEVRQELERIRRAVERDPFRG
jgi:hypothetical protein